MAGRTDLPDETDKRRTRGLQPEPTLTATDARQGRRGRPVLIVLLGGLLLAMLIWVPIEWWGNSIAPDSPANQPPEQVSPGPAESSVPQSSPTPSQ